MKHEEAEVLRQEKDAKIKDLEAKLSSAQAESKEAASAAAAKVRFVIHFLLIGIVGMTSFRGIRFISRN